MYIVLYVKSIKINAHTEIYLSKAPFQVKT